MNLHEHQGKELLGKYNVPVQQGIVAFTPEEVEKNVRELVSKGATLIILKAQIHAGGRGKGYMHNVKTNLLVFNGDKELRGVKVLPVKTAASTAREAKDLAKKMLGNKLVTIQTGESGKIVNRLLVANGIDIAKEFYCTILLDRETGKNLIMVSSEGGVEIEKVAEESPEKIIKERVDIGQGLLPFQARKLAFGLGLEGIAQRNFVNFITLLYNAYLQLDASMVEINPMVLTPAGEIIAVDAKVSIDDNALYRHSDIEAMRDKTEEDPLEVLASENDLNYIKLDGNVGCMVNGAGLAMATMDIIKLAGGAPANFLDVGGTANSERVAAAFKLMMSDPNVEAVLINIFGGIVRCDRVASGIIEAMKTVEVKVPVIVRLDGTNAVEARHLLENSPLKFLVGTTLAEAAEKISEAMSFEVINCSAPSAKISLDDDDDDDDDEVTDSDDDEDEDEIVDDYDEGKLSEFDAEEIEDPDSLDFEDFDADDLDDDLELDDDDEDDIGFDDPLDI